ncbi:MAG: RDD family protein [Chitinophagales bacterium]
MESDWVGKICPYCQSPIEEGTEVNICPNCQNPHHQECWQANGGCTTFGCSSAPVVGPTVRQEAGFVRRNSRTIRPAGHPEGVICPYCNQVTSSTITRCQHCQGLLYAGFWNRFWAWNVDAALLGIIGYLLFIIGVIFSAILAGIFSSSPNSTPNIGDLYIAISVICTLLFLISHWLYYAIFECSSLRATPGKILFGLAVTNYEGQKITFGRASARFFSSILSSLLLCMGFISAAFTPRKQALHDIIARAVVVRSVRPNAQGQDENQLRRQVIGWLTGLSVIAGLAFFAFMAYMIGTNMPGGLE